MTPGSLQDFSGQFYMRQDTFEPDVYFNWTANASLARFFYTRWETFLFFFMANISQDDQEDLQSQVNYSIRQLIFQAPIRILVNSDVSAQRFGSARFRKSVETWV